MKIFKSVICILFCLLQILLISCSFNENSITNDTNKVLDTNKDIVENTSQLSEEKNDAKISTNNLAIGGESDYCCHVVKTDENLYYDNSYHCIPSELIFYIGEDNFNQWIEKIKSYTLNETNGCNDYCSIVNFIRDFNIPYDIFNYYIKSSSMYYNYDYNLDIIYSGNDKIIEQYYTSDRIDDITNKKFFSIIKSNIKSYLYNNKNIEFTEWINNKNNDKSWSYSDMTSKHQLINSGINIKGDAYEIYSDTFSGDIRQWSIIEAISYFDIPRSIIEEYIKIATDAFSPSCNLNIDKLYSINYTDLVSNLKISTNNSTYNNIDPLIIDNEFIIYS